MQKKVVELTRVEVGGHELHRIILGVILPKEKILHIEQVEAEGGDINIKLSQFT